jgi:ferritin-like metal-binding protein YciE
VSQSMTMSMQTPQDLFVHELSDIYDAEQIIVQMLEEAQGLVQSPQLLKGLRMHAEQSRQHAQRVQQVLQRLGAQPHPVQSYPVRGLYQQLQEVQSFGPSPEVLQGLVVGGAAKTEHLEIAAYTGLIEKAQAMGQREAAQLLRQNLQDEQQMLQRVEDISQQLTQQMVAMSGTEFGQQSATTVM